MHLLRVERLDEPHKRKIKPLWLIWVGQHMPELSQIWHQYLRRFVIAHWYRLLAQRKQLDFTPFLHSRTI